MFFAIICRSFLLSLDITSQYHYSLRINFTTGLIWSGIIGLGLDSVLIL